MNETSRRPSIFLLFEDVALKDLLSSYAYNVHEFRCCNRKEQFIDSMWS